MPKKTYRNRSRTRSRSRHMRDRSISRQYTSCRSRGEPRDRSRSRSHHEPRYRSDSEDCTHRRRDSGRARDLSRSGHKSRSLRKTPPRSLPSPVSSSVNGNLLKSTLNDILARLNALEQSSNSSVTQISDTIAESGVSTTKSVTIVKDHVIGNGNAISRAGSLVNLSDGTPQTCVDNSGGSFSTRDQGPTVCSTDTVSASSISVLAEAIKSLQPIKSQNYYVSSFDPSIHDIDLWCSEVDRAMVANGWGDQECLSRVALCLKGDAKIWLNEWVTRDRTWSNFKDEFKPLCPRKLDYANILFECMNTTSDKYTTYAEYARRTLLRLRVVKGLSEELRTLIVIRGIDNPQIRAAAANANLAVGDLVSFLSIYIKPNRAKTNNTDGTRQVLTKSSPKCYICGRRGHLGQNCKIKKRTNTENSSNTSTAPTTKAALFCKFCKKPGHSENVCFAKDRSEQRNQRNVNLCTPRTFSNIDVVPAVVQGVPMDVLIDSGAHNISLISSDVLRFLSCQPKFTQCTLKGISEHEIVATSYVTVTVELFNISLEADLVVVPSACMNTSIVIGTDVLNRDGVMYVRTKNRQYITRVVGKTTGQVNQVQTIETSSIKTPLLGGDLESLVRVLKPFSTFLISGTATTTVTTGEMEIKLTSSTPITYRPYKLSYGEKLKVREIIRDLLEKGIIRESRSQYASPIILVKKKDGTDRMCVDFRALNRVTEKERYPLPLIDDQIDRLGRYTFFSSLDMATGFHQIKIRDDCIHYTGFITPEGHYEYLKMPYGLTNSPIVYQRIINYTLREFIDSGNVLVYIDDVLLLSNTVEDGILLLKNVLQKLTESGFSINIKKCCFLTTEVEYLGRLVSGGQVRPSAGKVEALKNSPAPKNVKQVRQFLGLAGYFRRYIAGYATKTACIALLTRKGVQFHWGPEQEQVRQDLITSLTSEPILTIFKPELPSEVHTDASSAGYGAILMQTHPDGSRHVIAYFSKVAQGAESKYHSYELETLAVVRALQHFRHYLIGIQFKVITDCNALKSTENKKDLLPRVARWWIYLQDFHFTMEYRKGVLLQHADYLSRNPVAAVGRIYNPRNWAQIAQAADGETRDLMQKLSEGQLDSNHYAIRNELLYHKYTPVGEEPRLLCYIPKGHRLSLLRIFHDEHEHVSFDKTLHLILKHFWFPGLRQFVKKYISHCLVCMSKKRVPRAPLQNITSWPKPNTPFDTVHVDALGPLTESEGYKFVLILVDSFTKFCLLYPMYRQDAGELKKVMTQAISLFGVPKLLVTDRGRMFEARSFVQWISELGTDLHYITPEMHNSNGQAERYVRTVLNMLRVQVGYRNASWSETLWKLQLVLNITKQKTTQASPISLMIGTEATTPVIHSLIRDVAMSSPVNNREALREVNRYRAAELLRKNQENQNSSVNQSRHHPRTYAVDDLAFVIKYSQSTGKLDPGIRGPYKVTKVLPNGRYELKLLSGGKGKTTQAAAQYMVPWKGEWCPESCAIFFEDGNNDDVIPEKQHDSDGSVSAGTSMPIIEDEDQEADQASETTPSRTLSSMVEDEP